MNSHTAKMPDNSKADEMNEFNTPLIVFLLNSLFC